MAGRSEPSLLMSWSPVFAVALLRSLAHTAPRRGGQSAPAAIWVLNPFRLARSARLDGHPATVRNPPEQPPSGDAEAALLLSELHPDLYRSALVERTDDWSYRLPIPAVGTPGSVGEGGAFTIHGTDPRPLDASCRSSVRQIRLLPDAVDGAWRFLRLAGVRHLVYSALEDSYSELLQSRMTLTESDKAEAEELKRGLQPILVGGFDVHEIRVLVAESDELLVVKPRLPSGTSSLAETVSVLLDVCARRALLRSLMRIAGEANPALQADLKRLSRAAARLRRRRAPAPASGTSPPR